MVDDCKPRKLPQIGTSSSLLQYQVSSIKGNVLELLFRDKGFLSRVRKWLKHFGHLRATLTSVFWRACHYVPHQQDQSCRSKLKPWTMTIPIENPIDVVLIRIVCCCVNNLQPFPEDGQNVIEQCLKTP